MTIYKSIAGLYSGHPGGLRTLLFAVFVVLQCVKSVSAQERIQWLTWEQAQARQLIEKRKFLVEMHTSWCGWCRKMEKTTFAEEGVAHFINRYYYAIRFDAESRTPVTIKGKEYVFVPDGLRGYHSLAAELLQGKMSYPSTVFLNEELQLIQAVPGYQHPADFEKMLTYFYTNSHKTTPWQKFSLAFKREKQFLPLIKGDR